GGIAPLRRRLGTGVGLNVLLPERPARGGVQAIKQARGAERVNLVGVEGRRGPRPRAGHHLAEASRIQTGPELAARPGVIANHRFIGAALLLGVETIADHSKGRPARADAMAPDLLRRMGLPVGVDANAGPPAIAVRPPEARPVARLQDEGTGD